MLKTANCLREGAELTADADLVVVDGAATLHGGYDKAVFLSGESVVAYDAAITEADASCNITLNGTAEALHARNKCTAISGIGSKAAEKLYETAQNGDYISVDEFQQLSGASKATIDALDALGALGNLPKSNQLSLF